MTLRPVQSNSGEPVKNWREPEQLVGQQAIVAPQESMTASVDRLTALFKEGAKETAALKAAVQEGAKETAALKAAVAEGAIGTAALKAAVEEGAIETAIANAPRVRKS
jgi:hypothetical protein